MPIYPVHGGSLPVNGSSLVKVSNSSALTFGKEGCSLAQLRPFHMMVLLSLNTVEALVLIGTPAGRRWHSTHHFVHWQLCSLLTIATIALEAAPVVQE
jgi:hypothetical protein